MDTPTGISDLKNMPACTSQAVEWIVAPDDVLPENEPTQ